MLTLKLQQNNDKMRDLEDMVRNHLGRARMFVAGTAAENTSEDAQTRISKGFQELVARAYPYLSMLRGVTYLEADIGKYLDNSQQSFLVTDVANLSEAEQEMLAFITRSKNTGTRITIKSLLEAFEKKPYGWYYAAMLCILAKLITRGKVELREDSNLHENPRVIESSIRNTSKQGNIVIHPCEIIDERDLAKAKEFYREFFETPTSANEVKSIGQDIQRGFLDLQSTLDELLIQQSKYPFLSVLKSYSDEIREMRDKPYVWFVISMKEQRSHWIAAKEEVIDPIRRFMIGAQKAIFDRAREFMSNNQANSTYLDADSMVEIQSTLNDPECFKGGKIQQLKAKVDELQQQVDRLLVSEKEKAVEVGKKKLEQMLSSEDFSTLDSYKQAELKRPIEQAIHQVENQAIIAVIRDLANRMEGDLWTQVLTQLSCYTQQMSPGGGTTPPPPPVTFVPVSSVKVSMGLLQTEDDVNRYVSELKNRLIQLIHEGKRINL